MLPRIRRIQRMEMKTNGLLFARAAVALPFAWTETTYSIIVVAVVTGEIERQWLYYGEHEFAINTMFFSFHDKLYEWRDLSLDGLHLFLLRPFGSHSAAER